MGFFEGGVSPLIASVVTHQRPLYVQFYITARCNLRCQQCNVIYSNGDQEECSLQQIEAIAKNLKKIGTSVVLLTGGEPFARSDLPEIAQIFVSHGIHPRIQTNGFASEEALLKVANLGIRDISISLDSLSPAQQDQLNGGYEDSWVKAIEKVSFINRNFPTDSFCVFGCVLSPTNVSQVIPVVEFASRIGWWVSIVPAHQTEVHEPRSFATYDPKMVFHPDQYREVSQLISQLKRLRRSGLNIYDSDEYLDDVFRYISKSPIRWRRRNDGVCDAPNLYFAIQPNGDMAVCCDYRLQERVQVYADNFPQRYRSHVLREAAGQVTKACSGCMYGSFPEISISARFYRPMFDRAKLFLGFGNSRELVPLSTHEVLALAKSVAASSTNAS